MHHGTTASRRVWTHNSERERSNRQTAERVTARAANFIRDSAASFTLERPSRGEGTEDITMIRWLALLITFVGFSYAGAASAGNWSIGYTDYGRHGGYSVAIGNHGYRSFSAFGYGPSWGYSGYGYRDPWADPWYLSSYRTPVRYYNDCYYGCGPRYYGGYYAPRYYSSYYAPRYYGGYSYGYRYSSGPRYYDRGYRSYGHRDYGYRDHGRYSRGYSRAYDRDRHGSDRNDYRRASYERSDRGYRSQSAYDRAREHVDYRRSRDTR